MSAAAPVSAAVPQQVRLQIARQPVRAALIELALQADLSLGGALDACHGQAPALSGRFNLEEALARLVQASGCTFQVVGRQTIVIHAAPAALPAASPRSSPTAPPPPPAPPIVVPLTDIVVTGLRRTDLPGRTPYAISALSSAELARGQHLGLQDLTGQIAGMAVTNLGAGRDKILLRGLSDGAFTGQAQSIVALYLNDVPITYNAPDPDLRLADIERVEVMRGPQGTLYGGGSIGGVVRITTRRPDLDTRSATLLVGGSVSRGDGLGSELEAAFNAPLVTGKLALRAVAYSDRQPGYIDNPSLGVSHANTSGRDGGRLALRWAVAPEWEATLALTHQSINSADTQYGIKRLGPFQRDTALREPHDNDFDQASVTVVGSGEWGRVTASAARLGHQFDSRYDASANIMRFGGLPGLASFDEAKHIDLTVGEVTYASPAERRVRGLVGAFFSTGETRLATDLIGNGRPLYTEARTDKVNEAAIYGEATLDLTQKLSATVGLRAFDFRFDTESTVAQGAAARSFAAKGDASGVSPKLLLAYNDGPTLIYLQAAEGYRPGGFNTAGPIGQMFDTPLNPLRRYAADELWNYELGAKARWFDNRLQMRMAIFYATWEAVQSDQYTADGLGFTANIGDGDNRGIEFEAAWKVSDRLEVRGAALLNDPEITRADPNFTSRPDAGLPGVSKSSAGFTLDYHRPLGGDRTLRLLGQVSYIGASRLTFDNAARHAMGEYVDGRLGAIIEAPSWTVSASVDNVLNRASNTFSFGNPFIINRDEVITPQRPRTLSVRLSRRF